MTRTISFCRTKNALLALKATSKFGDADTIEVMRHIKSKMKTSEYVERKNRRTEVVFDGSKASPALRASKIMALLSFRYEPMRMKLKTKLLNVVIARYAQKRPSETEMPRIVGLWNGLISNEMVAAVPITSEPIPISTRNGKNSFGLDTFRRILTEK